MRSLPSLALILAFASGCGPKRVAIDPAQVVNVSVRPRSGQSLFCPGDPFQVEVVAKLRDGSTCSNVDNTRPCGGKTGVVMDPQLLRLEGSAGAVGGDFVWTPPADPLTTAATGLTLRAWLEGVGEGGPSKSMVGEIELTPVYQCAAQKERHFEPPAQFGMAGEAGVRGPDVTVAVTSLSTPFYPNAALVRIEIAGQRMYLVSPSADQPVRVVSRGQAGAPGVSGADGQPGQDGAPAGENAGTCDRGGAGTPGTDAEPGRPGGAGGPGGTVRVVVDEAASDALRGRVIVASLGGEGGRGGFGGHGGRGGRGGAGGPGSIDCMDTYGPAGADGQDGANGPPGANGPAGEVVYEAAPRDALFGTELGIIQQIEATPAKK